MTNPLLEAAIDRMLAKRRSIRQSQRPRGASGTIRNTTMTNIGGVGIYASGQVDLDIHSVVMENVPVPFQLEGEARMHARGVKATRHPRDPDTTGTDSSDP